MNCRDPNGVLHSIKNMLGVPEECESFDLALVGHINSALFALETLGVPMTGLKVRGYDEVWTDIVQEENVDAVRQVVYLRTALVFDPPSTSYIINAYENVAREIEWRLMASRKEEDSEKL